MKCFRPRFTVRTLVIFITLVCAYFGAWNVTKKYGVPSSFELPPFGVRASSPAPFIVRYDEIDFTRAKLIGPGLVDLDTTYYRSSIRLWLFGPNINLPFEWYGDTNGLVF